MSSPIKPPGSTPADAVQPTGTEDIASKETQAAEVSPADTAAWQAQIDAATATAATDGPSSPLAVAPYSVDQLVNEALASSDISGLSTRERADFEVDLRANLASDPTLGSLIEDMHRDT